MPRLEASANYTYVVGIEFFYFRLLYFRQQGAIGLRITIARVKSEKCAIGSRAVDSEGRVNVAK